jgi:hypothetical protein
METAAARLPADDEFSGWAVCQAQEGEGGGTFKGLASHYDAQGRLVLMVDYDGALGQFKSRNMLDSSAPSSYIDFTGGWRITESLLLRRGGPLRQARLSLRPDGTTRLAFTWREYRAPKKADLELFCRDDRLAVRYTFENGGEAQLTALAMAKKNEPAPIASPALEEPSSGSAEPTPLDDPEDGQEPSQGTRAS